MKYNNYVLGQVIRKYRIRKPYTLSQMAHDMEISISTWCRIEDGKSSLKVSDFPRFCDIVEISYLKFFNAVNTFKPKVTR